MPKKLLVMKMYNFLSNQRCLYKTPILNNMVWCSLNFNINEHWKPLIVDCNFNYLYT